MTIATGGGAGGALEQGGGAGGGLADLVETVLDKGVVIDAQVVIGVIGIPLVEINARVVVASIDTYLRFAQMVDRLDISGGKGKNEGLGGLVGNVTEAAQGLTSGLGEAAGGAARELGSATGGLTGADREAPPERRPRRRENEEG
ncbi:gas vesicle protein GvpJ [Micromonospora okii]|uniref:gas vesicle protein GvpJ n=1 Tax=Micromonospora okii TaxID=1182970 RepID=UPI001E43CA7A|nr:gas vesicle protein GvpJ [Micromonospora okii]